MNLSLDPAIERLIHEQVKSGRYRTPEDVVSAAVASLGGLHEPGGALYFERGELDRLIAEGEADIERGDVVDGDESHARRRARLAQLRHANAT